MSENVRPARRILMVCASQEESAFGRFLREVLDAEGLTGFEVVDLETAPVPDAASGDLLILARCNPTGEQIDRLQAAVASGAGLILVHPSAMAAAQFGWRLVPHTAYPGWIRISDGLPGAGLPIQTHVPVVGAECRAEAPESEVLATTTDPDWRDTGFPAVVTHAWGPGRIALFFYDVGKSVARIRFGNPELAGTVGNGHWDWPHALDLFVGHVDDRVSHVPQADFHGQLLAHAATGVTGVPLARVWYYETSAQRSAVVFQSDDDWSEPDHFEALTAALEEYGGRGAFYLMENTKLPDHRVRTLREAGHTFGPHVNAWQDRSGGPIDLSVEFPRQIDRQTALFRRRYGACTATLQSHRAPWLGYVSLVPLHIELGYRMLFAYLSGPRHMINRFMCGSGRPLRFCDAAGEVLDCWQQPVPTYDDQSLVPRITEEPEAVFAEFDRIFTDAVERTHTAIGLLSHPVSFFTYSRPFIERCFRRAHASGTRIWNPDAWLDFQDRRRNVRVLQYRGKDGTPSLIVKGLRGRIALMIPADGERWSANANGARLEVKEDLRLGRRYAFVDVEGQPGGGDVSVVPG